MYVCRGHAAYAVLYAGDMQPMLSCMQGTCSLCCPVCRGHAAYAVLYAGDMQLMLSCMQGTCSLCCPVCRGHAAYAVLYAGDMQLKDSIHPCSLCCPVCRGQVTNVTTVVLTKSCYYQSYDGNILVSLHTGKELVHSILSLSMASSLDEGLVKTCVAGFLCMYV